MTLQCNVISHRLSPYPEWSQVSNVWWSIPKCQTKKVFFHDDVIQWKHFPRYWPFARGIHRSPVNSPHKGQWRGALMFSLICAWINSWVNNSEAGDLRCHRAHYDVSVMLWWCHHLDKWHYWPFECGIHQSPVHFQPKDQYCSTLMVSLFLAWSFWINNPVAGKMRCNAHVTPPYLVMCLCTMINLSSILMMHLALFLCNNKVIKHHS